MQAASRVQLPRRLVALVLFCCVAIPIIDWLRIPLIRPEPPVSELEADPFFRSEYFLLRADFERTLLEWTIVCVSIVTAVCAFLHYFVKRDAATPIVGFALLCTGMMDGFHTLAATRLLPYRVDDDGFIAQTWAISRIFHAVILAIGTGIFVYRTKPQWRKPSEDNWRFIVLVGILMGVSSYGMVYACTVIKLPSGVIPNAMIPRRYDAFALIVYLFAGGILFPRFHAIQRTLFSHGLIVSLVPLVIAQFYAAFFSKESTDSALIVAQLLTLVGYIVPLAGLLCDYTIAYRAEVDLRSTHEKLRIAREIQKGLLPREAPAIAGFDLAGYSEPAGSVGGDYFDFIKMPGGTWALAVGDVSGHDLGASILMSQTRAYLRAESRTASDIAAIMTELNGFLMRDVRDRRFVSLFLGQIAAGATTLRYVAAGQAGHIVRRDGTIVPLEVTGPLLGVIEEEFISATPVALEAGDTLVVFTDGVAETPNAHGELFGNTRALEIIVANRASSAQEMARALVTAVRKYCDHSPASDDLTLLLAKRI